LFDEEIGCDVKLAMQELIGFVCVNVYVHFGCLTF